MKDIILKISDLTKSFKLGKRLNHHAVDNVSLDVYRGETLGIVGESGCGKTTLGRTILNFHQPTEGSVLYDGVCIHKASKKDQKNLKRKIQMIFQDPYSSLNPRMTVRDIISEGIDAQGSMNKTLKLQRVQELLELVGLQAAHADRYPHEFSGGQRQRISIARTLAVNPEFIVCDEPTSALDVSVQAQIINLLMKLQKEMKITYVFIAHDLATVHHISDRIAVMYLGEIVELGDSEKIYQSPKHPYTQALMGSVPSIDLDDPMLKRRVKLSDESRTDKVESGKKGCKFAPRCKAAMPLCFDQKPTKKIITNGNWVSCHLYS